MEHWGPLVDRSRGPLADLLPNHRRPRVGPLRTSYTPLMNLLWNHRKPLMYLSQNHCRPRWLWWVMQGEVGWVMQGWLGGLNSG